ncbi:MAG: hypothetical protein P4L49_00480 [Desulfosporosinus sp.]|nr:hypothetical protein [Desulfosporosinus sp.]
MLKKVIIVLLILSIAASIAGCNSTMKPEVTNSSLKLSEQTIYQIPSGQQKEKYSVEDFKNLFLEYLKLNNIVLETLPENDKTKMSSEDRLKYYTIYEITPKEAAEEIGC